MNIIVAELMIYEFVYMQSTLFFGTISRSNYFYMPRLKVGAEEESKNNNICPQHHFMYIFLMQQKENIYDQTT